MARRSTVINTIARQLPPASWAAILFAVLVVGVALAATH
jgi:hypothetical protein